MKIIENFIENKFIFLLLLFLFLLIIQEPSFRLFSSETHYIGEALQKIINYFPHENSAYIQPDNIFSYRYIFDILVTLFYYISNDIVISANIGRLLLAILFTISIYHLSKTLNLNIVYIIISLSFFMLMNQQLVGGDKIFGNGFQSSALSFAIVILKISFVLRKKYLPFFILGILATYLHFLIGGYWFLICIISAIFIEKKFYKFLYYFILYILFCIPLILSLYIDIIFNTSNIIQIADIFAFRSKHHFLPFYNYSTLVWWLPGILLTIIFLIYSIFAINNNFEKSINIIIAISSVQILFFFFLISPIEKFNFFSNFDPFRHSTILLLLTFCSIASRISKFKIDSFIVLIIVMPISLNVIYPAIGRIIYNNPDALLYGNNNSKIDLINYVKKNTNEKDTVILINDNQLGDFEILTKRPTYFSWKLIPSHSKGINEWHNRYNKFEKLNEITCKNSNINFEYLIISPNNKEQFSRCGNLVYENDNYLILKK